MVTEQIPNEKGRRSPITTILIISLILGGAVFLLNRVITASANSTDYSLAMGTYPQIVGSRIASCSLCHTSSIPNLNPYGKAYKALGRGNANSLIMIENLDSDGDGFTNIQEINYSEQISEKLMEFSPAGNEFEPRLATEWRPTGRWSSRQRRWCHPS